MIQKHIRGLIDSGRVARSDSIVADFGTFVFQAFVNARLI
jgi:hypothetical protein